MGRARINYWTDVAALIAALVVFPTGLILLIRFHVGPDGAHRTFGWGLSRTIWINMHRWAAIAMTVAVAVHIQTHWRAIVNRVHRTYLQLPGKAKPSDLTLYVGFAVATLAAFAAWLVLPTSLHHTAIDIHNIAGLILLTVVVMHVRRHLRWLIGSNKENCHASQQRNLRNARPLLVERRRRF